MIGIYKFTNKYNRKVYIGQSVDIESRYNCHRRSINYDSNTYWHNALKKYGIDGFDFEVIHECPENQLNYWEQFYIKYYGSNLHDYGYNSTDGGNSGRRTEETRIKMSIAFTGRKWSEEDKISLGIAHLGFHHTEQTKERLHETTSNLWKDPEYRNHMIETRKGKPSKNKGKHKVWDDDTHTKYHFE